MAIMTAISVIITFFIILLLLNVRAAKVRNNSAPSKQKWKTSLVKLADSLFSMMSFQIKVVSLHYPKCHKYAY
jgi:hypothetical protein